MSFESNSSDGEINLINTRWQLSAEWRLGYNHRAGYETESHFGRFVDRNQFLFVYAGWDWRYRDDVHGRNIFGQDNTKNKRSVAHFGIQYKMPWLVIADASLDHTGYFRIQFRRDDIPLTRRLRLWAMWNTDHEFATGARYILTKYVSASTHYDSDMGAGIGLTVTY